MRNIVHDAVAQARGILGQVTGEIQQGNTLSDDEMLHRYELMHRGNPLGMAQFVAQHAPPGGNLLTAMRGYEDAMEKLRRQRGAR